MTSSTRTPTDVDRIAEEWVDTAVELNPVLGTYIGRKDADARFADYSPDGLERSAEALRRTISQLDAASPADDVDAVTVADLRSELALDLEAHELGLPLRDLNVIASPAQELREVFDLMSTDGPEEWQTISTRLAALPAALDGYIETLRLGIARGIVPAKRQVREVAAQAHKLERNDGFFAQFVQSAPSELPSTLRTDLSGRAAHAGAAYARLASFLEHELLPAAGDADAVGRDIYGLQSRRFLGATIVLD